jgi:hypothetical protein
VCRGSGARVVQADTVAAVGRHVVRDAQGGPDRPRRHPRLDGLLGGEPADVPEDEVASQHPAIGLAELLVDGYPEFTQSHCTSLTSERGPPSARGPAGTVGNDERPGVTGAFVGSGSPGGSARNEIRVELGDEVVRKRVRNGRREGYTFDDREAITDFTHDD